MNEERRQNYIKMAIDKIKSIENYIQECEDKNKSLQEGTMNALEEERQYLADLQDPTSKVYHGKD